VLLCHVLEELVDDDLHGDRVVEDREDCRRSGENRCEGRGV
jgi:hypothetical protein